VITAEKLKLLLGDQKKKVGKKGGKMKGGKKTVAGCRFPDLGGRDVTQQAPLELSPLSLHQISKAPTHPPLS